MQYFLYLDLAYKVKLEKTIIVLVGTLQTCHCQLIDTVHVYTHIINKKDLLSLFVHYDLKTKVLHKIE